MLLNCYPKEKIIKFESSDIQCDTVETSPRKPYCWIECDDDSTYKLIKIYNWHNDTFDMDTIIIIIDVEKSILIF